MMPLVFCDVPGTVYISHLLSLQSIKQIRPSLPRGCQPEEPRAAEPAPTSSLPLPSAVTFKPSAGACPHSPNPQGWLLGDLSRGYPSPGRSTGKTQLTGTDQSDQALLNPPSALHPLLDRSLRTFGEILGRTSYHCWPGDSPPFLFKEVKASNVA